MSKTDLKRELANLSREQLIEVILDAYTARKEIKSYFDFFANPDVDSLLEKYQKDIAKELSRSKWRRSKARISHINKSLKEFESYGPGAEPILLLYIFAVEMLMLTEYQLTFTDSLYKGIKNLIIKTLDFADRHGESSKAIETFSRVIDPDTPGYSRIVKRIVTETVNSYNSANSIK